MGIGMKSVFVLSAAVLMCCYCGPVQDEAFSESGEQDVKKEQQEIVQVLCRMSVFLKFGYFIFKTSGRRNKL